MNNEKDNDDGYNIFIKEKRPIIDPRCNFFTGIHETLPDFTFTTLYKVYKRQSNELYMLHVLLGRTSDEHKGFISTSYPDVYELAILFTRVADALIDLLKLGQVRKTLIENKEDFVCLFRKNALFQEVRDNLYCLLTTFTLLEDPYNGITDEKIRDTFYKQVLLCMKEPCKLITTTNLFQIPINEKKKEEENDDDDDDDDNEDDYFKEIQGLMKKTEDIVKQSRDSILDCLNNLIPPLVEIKENEHGDNLSLYLKDGGIVMTHHSRMFKHLPYDHQTCDIHLPYIYFSQEDNNEGKKALVDISNIL